MFSSIEHHKACVDAESFVKIMIDWLVYEQLTNSPNQAEYKAKLPLHDDEIYFYVNAEVEEPAQPEVVPPEQAEPEVVQEETFEER